MSEIYRADLEIDIIDLFQSSKFTLSLWVVYCNPNTNIYEILPASFAKHHPSALAPQIMLVIRNH